MTIYEVLVCVFTDFYNSERQCRIKGIYGVYLQFLVMQEFICHFLLHSTIFINCLNYRCFLKNTSLLIHLQWWNQINPCLLLQMCISQGQNKQLKTWLHIIHRVAWLGLNNIYVKDLGGQKRPTYMYTGLVTDTRLISLYSFWNS